MIIPKQPDRRLDATAALQSAFDESTKTGDYVFLEGYYKTTKPLVISGADVRGTFTHAGSGNWSCEIGSPVGPARIDIGHGGTNAVAVLSVAVCGTGIKSIHATVTGILNFSGYNEAHMTLQQAD